MQVYLKTFSETAFRREKQFSCITKIHITHSEVGLLIDLNIFLNIFLEKNPLCTQPSNFLRFQMIWCSFMKEIRPCNSYVQFFIIYNKHSSKYNKKRSLLFFP